MECKRHDWRVGAYKGEIINGKVKKIGLWIWCFKCNKKILAYYKPKNVRKCQKEGQKR